MTPDPYDHIREAFHAAADGLMDWREPPEPVSPARKVLELLAVRDAQDAFSRASGWVVVCAHDQHREATETLLGPFTDASDALVYAARHESEMREEGDRGWRCTVHPMMPVT